MLQLIQRLVNRRNDENGASAVEYGLLVAAIAAIIVLIVFAIGKFVKAGFADTCAGLATGSYSASTGSCPS
jgi:pilus assembly protein Flp/PilA